MGWLHDAIFWFSGGAQQYHPLTHCMKHDWFWITVTVTLDLAVAVGYVLIASHWRRNERTLPTSAARTALTNMRGIFTFCGLCGYLFIPIKLVWPAWRLYDLFMLGLVFYTWRYALNAKGLKVLYSAVGRTDRLESELSAARDEARRKGAFLNAVSHDLRTPLNGLMLNASLAELHLADTPDASQAAILQALAEIKSAARLTADLLDGLLEYARLDGAGDHVHAGEFPLGDLIANTVAAHHHAAAAKGVELSAAVPAGLVVRTDRLKLERILNNLAGNGVKYTPAGSVRVTAEVAGGDLEIHVTDTGVGIAAEHIGRLFDEFYQVENHERDRQKGFGLGLAIGRRLAQQLGGDLVVASTPGRGSRFSVLLPGVVAVSALGTVDVAGGLGREFGLAADGRPAGAPGAAPPGQPVPLVQHPAPFGRPTRVVG